MGMPDNYNLATESSGTWPEELCFGKIRAVPSYHYRPEFSRLVRQQIKSYKPDVVAVELPDIYFSSICRAVGFLPTLSAVVTPGNEFIAISPEDSIIEGIRTALENGIAVEFVDLEVAESDKQSLEGRDFKADSALLERMDLPSFISLSAGKILDTTANEAFIKREEHMAHNLQNLLTKHERILFICGMVHWKRIRSRMLQKNQRFSHRFSKMGAVAAIDAHLLQNITGTIPFRTGCYEEARRTGDFSLQEWLTRLFNEAAADAGTRLAASELGDLLKFCRNQTILDGELTPGIENLTDTAAGIVGHEYAAFVHARSMKYAFAGMPVGSPLSIGFDGSFYLEPGHFQLQPHRRISDGVSKKTAGSFPEDKRQSGRNHPYSDVLRQNPGRLLSDRWGRYANEMDEEERFIGTLERWAYHAGCSDEHLTTEFCDGLIDGLDVRETIRDLVYGRIFVKEYTNEEPRFSAVLVEFADDLKNCGVPIYTYGRHKGLAFCSPEVPNLQIPGTASYEFGLLLSFKRLIDDRRLFDYYDQMNKLFYKDKSDQREILLKMAMQSCEAEELLIVAPKKSLSAYREIVGRLKPAGRNNFSTLSREDIWNHACEKIKRFNVYYYP